jgi:hypothetical protein
VPDEDRDWALAFEMDSMDARIALCLLGIAEQLDSTVYKTTAPGIRISDDGEEVFLPRSPTDAEWLLASLGHCSGSGVLAELLSEIR